MWYRPIYVNMRRLFCWTKRIRIINVYLTQRSFFCNNPNHMEKSHWTREMLPSGSNTEIRHHCTTIYNSIIYSPFRTNQRTWLSLPPPTDRTTVLPEEETYQPVIHLSYSCCQWTQPYTHTQQAVRIPVMYQQCEQWAVPGWCRRSTGTRRSPALRWARWETTSPPGSGRSRPAAPERPGL